MSELVVDTDAMRRHADTLDHIGTRAEEAVQAAGDCVTGGEVYDAVDDAVSRGIRVVGGLR